MDEYIKKTWQDDEVITADSLNNIETGIVEAKQAAQQNGVKVESARIAANEAAEAAQAADKKAQDAQNAANTKAPAYAYGTDDLTAGESPLETGKLYFVYE